MAEINDVLLGALALPLLLLAGCGGGEVCDTTDYPAAPAGTTGTVHVSTGCPAAGADGSAAHPYPTIQQGVDSAQTGDAVLVAPGTYAENVSIAKQVTVVGGSPDGNFEAAPVLVTAPAAFAITIAEGTQGVQLFGLAVVDPIGVGVWVEPSAQATLMASRVEGAVAGTMQFGYGVLGEGSIVLCKTGITGSARAGVLVSGGSGEIEWSQISSNDGEGGIRVESASGKVKIHDNQLDGNEEVGIGVYSSTAVLTNNTITNTKVSGPMNFGDGVVVAPLSGQTVASSATLMGNTIQGCGRVGVIFSGGATGSITGNTIMGNGFGTAFAAGVWVQAGAGGPEGLSITRNTISGNRYVGVGLTNGARATIAENIAVSDTTAADVFTGVAKTPIGDGIEVFATSFAAISGNTLSDNGRFGIIFDTADSTSTVTGNTVSGSHFGVVVQNQAAPDLASDMLGGNMDGPSTVVGVGTFPIQTGNFELP